MADYNFGVAETKSGTRTDLARKFILKDDDGNILDLSDSFEFSDVLVSETRTIAQATVPFRTVHPRATLYGNPTKAAFELKILSLRKVEIEKQISQVRSFFDDAPGQVVDIYWIYDLNSDPYNLESYGNYFTYLGECSLTSFGVNRAYGLYSGASSIDLAVSSPNTTATREFPGDATTSRVIRGQHLHLASTNDGSIVLAVVRESDGQGLLTLDDQGSLKVLKEIKTHQSLPVITLGG